MKYAMNFLYIFCLLSFLCFESTLAENVIADGFPTAAEDLSARLFPFEATKMGRQAVRLLSIFLKWLLGNVSTDQRIVTDARKLGKYQEPTTSFSPFPCNLTFGRSLTRPVSADRIRPGDIDVIAAMGDSLVAGTGIASSLLIHTLVASRGLAALAGGQGSWHDFLTLPNIIKEFNPNLTGYSTGDSIALSRANNQNLNLGENAGLVGDLPFSAKVLVESIKNDPRIDMEKDWKLVSILVGRVDQCLNFCFWRNPQMAPFYVERILRRTFDYLMDNLPRTIVLFVNNLHMPHHLKSLKVEGLCSVYIQIACPCVKGAKFVKNLHEYERLMTRVLETQIRVVEDPRYRRKPDFRIAAIRVFDNPDILPKESKGIKNNFTDMRYLSPDCFHLSQKGQSLIAQNVWNYLLSPKERKPAWSQKDMALLCPTLDSPYFIL